jgi:hypothetical protein
VDRIRSVEPDSLYDENEFQDFFGEATYRLFCEQRAAGRVRHYAVGPHAPRYYLGRDVIAWLEGFAVEPKPAEPVPVAVAVDAAVATDTPVTDKPAKGKP